MSARMEYLVNLKFHYAFVLTQRGVRIKKLDLDNSGENMSNADVIFYNKKGIELGKTVTYTPEMNRISERLNLSVANTTQTLLSQTNLPKTL